MHLRALGALGFALAATTCDGGLEPEPICGRAFVGICGTVRFTGTPPEFTEAVYLVAFATFPQSCEDLLAFPPKFVPFPPLALPPPYAGSVPYGLPLLPERYEWVLAVWKKEGPVTLTVADSAIFRAAGDYRDPTDATRRGVVLVPSGGAVGSVDLTVDFDNLLSVSAYIPCEQ